MGEAHVSYSDSGPLRLTVRASCTGGAWQGRSGEEPESSLQDPKTAAWRLEHFAGDKNEIQIASQQHG